jgi:predicted metal-dependent phosphoesterase TrpH
MNSAGKSEKQWLKAELHAHCSLDPDDSRICRYTPEQLIARAAGLEYKILAITCHNLDVWTEDLSEYARNLGITLIPGMEVTAEKTRHVLVYNFHTGAENLDTLKKIRACSGKDTLVIAPHAFFPDRSCLRGMLPENLDVFDAIEYSGFQVWGLNFNRRSVRLAMETGKPLVGSGDIHFMWQLGRTFTWVHSKPDIQSVLDAIKRGFVRTEVSPLSWYEATAWWTTTFWRRAFAGNPLYLSTNRYYKVRAEAWACDIKKNHSKGIPSHNIIGSSLDKIENGRGYGAAQEGMKP